MADTSQEFLILVTSLSTAAMSSLGKLQNPMTGKIEKNLDAAKQQIDMISMLETKTKGNLSQEESRYLSEVITQLKVNYVQEVSSGEKKEDTSNKNKEADK